MVKNITLNKLSNIVKVVDKKEKDFVIESNGRQKIAKQAVSCLVSPQIGDTVSIIINDKNIYIVHVLSSNSEATIKTDKLILDIDEINLKSVLFNIDIKSIVSKIESFTSFIKKIELSSLFAKFINNDVQTISKTKKESTGFRVNNYETLTTKINTLEKKDSNIVKKNVNLEHKNVNSMFTKASGQIKLDAENINLG